MAGSEQMHAGVRCIDSILRVDERYNGGSSLGTATQEQGPSHLQKLGKVLEGRRVCVSWKQSVLSHPVQAHVARCECAVHRWDDPLPVPCKQRTSLPVGQCWSRPRFSCANQLADDCVQACFCSNGAGEGACCPSEGRQIQYTKLYMPSVTGPKALACILSMSSHGQVAQRDLPGQ